MQTRRDVRRSFQPVVSVSYPVGAYDQSEFSFHVHRLVHALVSLIRIAAITPILSVSFEVIQPASLSLHERVYLDLTTVHE